MTATGIRALVGLGLAAAVLSGCAEGQGPMDLFRRAGGEGAAGAGAAAAPGEVRLVERDVEAPEVFQTTDLGLWDGRPSLGGVWVAAPGVRDPERVIIRNTATGAFVIGALFRRERDNPGPRLQVSSDAAAALGMLAGQPARLEVTALRREEVPVAPEPAPTAIIDGPARVEEERLAPAAPAADAAAAPAARPAAAAPAAAAPAAAAAPPPAPADAAAASSLRRPWLQVGIFSVEANAERAARAMREAGLSAAIRREESQGKTFWRVVVGPAATEAERDALLRRIRALGYADAYAVAR